MSSKVVFESIGDFIMDITAFVFENVGNVFNDAMLVLGFIGLFYWLNYQRKLNTKAKNNPDQLI
ncbi:MAG: hypothetical protein R3277_07610 [Brumimicrobium sp.]|nr:hypothetical protein [Brumimicrobium sp.]